MYLQLLCNSYKLVLGTNAAGEFSLLYSPDSLRFSGSNKVLESHLKEICSASLGLSVEEVVIAIILHNLIYFPFGSKYRIATLFFL